MQHHYQIWHAAYSIQQIKKVPVGFIRGIQSLRPQLKTLTCNKSLISLNVSMHLHWLLYVNWESFWPWHCLEHIFRGLELWPAMSFSLLFSWAWHFPLAELQIPSIQEYTIMQLSQLCYYFYTRKCFFIVVEISPMPHQPGLNWKMWISVTMASCKLMLLWFVLFFTVGLVIF